MKNRNFAWFLCRSVTLREGGSCAEREKVTADWRKVHNEELHDLCYSPDSLGYQFN